MDCYYPGSSPGKGYYMCMFCKKVVRLTDDRQKLPYCTCSKGKTAFYNKCTK